MQATAPLTLKGGHACSAPRPCCGPHPCVPPACRTLRLLAAGVSDELRRLLHEAGFNLPPLYLRLVAPMNDPKALALLPLKVGGLCWELSQGSGHVLRSEAVLSQGSGLQATNVAPP